MIRTENTSHINLLFLDYLKNIIEENDQKLKKLDHTKNVWNCLISFKKYYSRK